MKRTLALCLFTSIIVLCAPEAQAKPHSKHSAVAVAKAATKKAAKLSKTKAATKQLKLSKDSSEPALVTEAPKAAPKASFWMAADPHVPLAVVRGHAIRSVGTRGKDCGDKDRWAKPKSAWRAVDAWGQFTGKFEVSDSETFDVTHCEEVTFEARSGKKGVGLFVSEDSSYKPTTPVGYSPTDTERKHFEQFLTGVEFSWVNARPAGKIVPIAKRTMFFHFTPPKEALGERVDGNGNKIPVPHHWAVAGGPTLVVAYLGEHGHWKVATVKRPLGLTDSYSPEAVFDMNGDGIPEIVYQSSDGPNYAERVLSLSHHALTWDDSAESVGGAAI